MRLWTPKRPVRFKARAAPAARRILRIAPRKNAGRPAAKAAQEAGMKARSRLFVNNEPEHIRAWRAFADPINQRIAEKWKYGEPKGRLAARVDRRAAHPAHQLSNTGPINAKSWRTI